MIAEMERAPDATATQAFLQAMPPEHAVARPGSLLVEEATR